MLESIVDFNSLGIAEDCILAPIVDPAHYSPSAIPTVRYRTGNWHEGRRDVDRRPKPIKWDKMSPAEACRKMLALMASGQAGRLAEESDEGTA